METQPSISETVMPPSEVSDLPTTETPPAGSYVKHAMRNMVRKRGTSVKHFVLTAVSLLGILVGLSYLTR